MAKRLKIPEHMKPPTVMFGSHLRELRRLTGVRPEEVAKHLDPRLGAADYLRLIEDPPRGVLACNVRMGRWWSRGRRTKRGKLVPVGTLREMVERTTRFLWFRAEPAARRWFRLACAREERRVSW